MKAVQRVAAYNVCVDEQQRLLLARLSDLTEAPGSWTLPGGGIDYGEHPEAGAIRELYEETGYVGRIVELLTVDSVHRVIADEQRQYHAIRIFYRTEIIGGDLVHETSGSTDRAEWFDRDTASTIPLIGAGALSVRLAFGDT